MEHGHRSIGIEGNVCHLMDEVVVSWTLADNPEVVNESLLCLSVLERNLKAGVFCHARRLIFIADSLADACDTLGLKMSGSTDVVAVDYKRNQRVQGAA